METNIDDLEHDNDSCLEEAKILLLNEDVSKKSCDRLLKRQDSEGSQHTLEHGTNPLLGIMYMTGF